jgi:hypothetical protein
MVVSFGPAMITQADQVVLTTSVNLQLQQHLFTLINLERPMIAEVLRYLPGNRGCTKESRVSVELLFVHHLYKNPIIKLLILQ